MKILVTGAAGFIGFHLISSLSKDISKVIVGIDNINNYYDIKLKYDRLKECGIDKGFGHEMAKSKIYSNYSFKKVDISNIFSLDRLFKNEHFDIVINLAAQAGVRYSLEDPHTYVRSNLVGFVNILECCRNYKIKHLIYASSSSVYGMNTKIPFSENDKTDNPVSLYAATKKANELLAYTYSHLFKLPTTGLRFFTVYGPWGRPDMAPMIFADAILTCKPIKVFNNGDMQRDFTYIDDVIKRINSVIKIIPDSKNQYYEILNLGNSNPIKLMDFIHQLENNLEKHAIFEMLPMQPGDVKITYADNSKLNNLISNNTYTPLEKGVYLFTNWYKSYFKL
jgi:UDP-glucuronate 4-epimerase